MTYLVGNGFDAHAFDGEKPLMLGGLLWPGEPGLAGHSDGDALIHAIVDALLGAASLGDIGSNFGTAEPQYENAPSELFLLRTRELLSDAGFSVVNVSTQVVGERPKISRRRDELQHHLSQLLGAPVSVSATTTDGMGFTGRGEGVAVYAVALVRASGDASSS